MSCHVRTRSRYTLLAIGHRVSVSACHIKGIERKKTWMFTTTILKVVPAIARAMLKHARSLSSADVQDKETVQKRSRGNTFAPNKVATASAAAAVDADPPLPKLLKAVEDGVKNPTTGESVVYWMRMGDLRSTSWWFLNYEVISMHVLVSDNRALSLASKKAQKDDIPLVVLFILSPQDYIAHDRSARRIDFVLRNLELIKASSTSTYCSFYAHTHTRILWQSFAYLFIR
jgi:hypothetical protein